MARLTAKEILGLKGTRQFSKLSVFSVEHAAAAETAGIDVLSSLYRPGQMAAMRAAAPSPFFVYALAHGSNASAEGQLRTAFAAKAEGADGVYCPMRFEVVELLAKEGFPVVGHVGLIPKRNTWAGGMKPFGKTAAEAAEVYRRVKTYEAAGAFAVEMELVPDRVAAEIARRTRLVVFSMGSGNQCDGQFLFANDVLGETEGKIPRHAKTYRDFRSEYARLQQERVAAFSEYRADIDSGAYPTAAHEVKIAEEEHARFLEFLDQAE